ncbi:MAG: hypothetical protein NZ828_09545 [Alphaproteobacteria bacterium]|nr:hypothetical protein [Alphaproteobacteria bacterium]
MAENDQKIFRAPNVNHSFMGSSDVYHTMTVPDRTNNSLLCGERVVLESGMRRAHVDANDSDGVVERNACGDAVNPETGLPKVNIDQAFKF